MANWPGWRADLFDPKKVPFSCRNSFAALSWIAEDKAFWLRNLRGGDEHTDLGRLLRVTPVTPDGRPAVVEWQLQPDALTARAGQAELRFQFRSPDRVAITGAGLGLRLEAGESKYNYAQSGDPIHICIARQDLRCDVSLRQGSAQLTAPWNGLSADRIALDLFPDASGLSAEINLYRVAPAPLPDPAPDLMADFREFLARLPQVPAAFTAGRLLAGYILWSGYVPAEGALSHPSIYMSKNWMTNIWSWDHCFVALALGVHQPHLAFDQMAAIFSAQNESGRLPDYINDRFAYWAFTKPPVHGWTFAQLRAAASEFYTQDRMRQVLGWLSAQARFWLSGPSWRGLPAYRHGNDAGWDNATCFAEGGPLVSPDLASFLVLQLDEIAALHRALGEAEAAIAASAKADALCAALIAELWDGRGFRARLQTDGRLVTTGQSLLLFLPLLLGKRLPAALRDAMLDDLLAPGAYLSRHGLATEALASPLYRANGYWRGPIWAPTTALFADALRQCDRPDLAQDLARRYAAMCNANGMAENHDAQTGQGLHDPAFAWTSAVFLTLAAGLPLP